jgi:hypothetical protein
MFLRRFSPTRTSRYAYPTYRAGDVFYPSSLRPDWRRVVDGWSAECRVDFVHEAVQRFGAADIGESFARNDPSNDVAAHRSDRG